uniref:Cleavage and polyadenylation specificity factor subunit 3 n=1 Tax=Rhabditophanes sp. KR3021 TaxID=114890 RepID=A0AC35TRA7_9BILA
MDSDFKFMPLGAGQEVGRSCHVLTIRNKNILLDCGIHPGLSGVDSLPFTDNVDMETIDMLLVTHFHLDHAGGVPWILTQTRFSGKCIMTHATKAIYRILMTDYLRLGAKDSNRVMFNEDDLERSLDKIQTIDFHEVNEINGVTITAYVAGHVLGACMFAIELDGLKVLYTGDFSRVENRHLCSADIPPFRPDILISEATFGCQNHEDQEVREKRFTTIISQVMKRGGKCLIPCFAVGTAQELLLILDEMWEKNKRFHKIKIYYCSGLAKKCMSVYQNYISSMNNRIQSSSNTSPFQFRHVENLKSIDSINEKGPCVVLASPAMLQSGMSRELFERWCTDGKNCCVLAGYSVEGTLAKHLLTEPEEIISMDGRRLPVKMTIASCSFAAHVDYQNASDFYLRLKPEKLILVHGEVNEMTRKQTALVNLFKKKGQETEIFCPKNLETLHINIDKDRHLLLRGNILAKSLEEGQIISGVMAKHTSFYRMIEPAEVMKYTGVNHNKHYQIIWHQMQTGFENLKYNLCQLCDDVTIDQLIFNIGDAEAPAFKLTMYGEHIQLYVYTRAKKVAVCYQWGPLQDSFADCIAGAVLHANMNPLPLKTMLILEENTNVPAITKMEFNAPMEH